VKALIPFIGAEIVFSPCPPRKEEKSAAWAR
jgi:hypothetical protein